MANGTNPIPEKLINFRVYAEGTNDLIGTASIDLPEITAMSDTVSGAGIAGEVDAPVLGHFQSMTCTINWRTIENDTINFGEQKAHRLEARGSQQVFDAANNEYKTVPVKLAMSLLPKKISLGSFNPGATTDSANEFEVIYLKIYIDGKEVAEIDKYNYIAKFNGTDYLSSVRADLGLN